MRRGATRAEDSRKNKETSFMSVNNSLNNFILFQHANVTSTPVAAVSTWNYTNYLAVCPEACVLNAVTIPPADTVTIAVKASTVIQQNKLHTAKHVNVST